MSDETKDDFIDSLISGTQEHNHSLPAKLSIEQRVKEHLYGSQAPPQFNDLLQMRVDEIVDDVGISTNDQEIDHSPLYECGEPDEPCDPAELTASEQPLQKIVEQVRECLFEENAEQQLPIQADTLDTTVPTSPRSTDQITLAAGIEQIVAIVNEILEQQACKKHELNESVAAAVAVGKSVELQLGDVDTKLGSIRNLCDATRINFDYAKKNLNASTVALQASTKDATNAFSELSVRTVAAERTSIFIISGALIVAAAIVGWFAGNRSGDAQVLGKLNDTSAMLACSIGKAANSPDGSTVCMLSSDGGVHYVVGWKIHK